MGAWPTLVATAVAPSVAKAATAAPALTIPATSTIMGGSKVLVATAVALGALATAAMAATASTTLAPSTAMGSGRQSSAGGGNAGDSELDDINGGTGGTGIYNSGIINSYEYTVLGGGGGNGGCAGLSIDGDAGDPGYGGAGIYNSGTINYMGAIIGNGGAAGGDPEVDCSIPQTGWGGYDISNGGSIDGFCGATLTYSSYYGTAANFISCYTVTFDQSGIPSGVTWGVTVSWGPFLLPVDYTGTGGSIAITAAQPITFSYDSPVAAAGVTYLCQSVFCSATGLPLFVDTTFTATYSQPFTAPTISAPTTIDSGQSATLLTTSSFGGGASPFTCQWLEEVGTGGFSGFGSSFPCSAGDPPIESTGALNAGSYQFELQVTDSSSPAQLVTSNAVAVTVNPALVCPSTSGGALMPVGATFTDQHGNTWVAPRGSLGGGVWNSYFFAGSQTSYPPPMLQGWGGVFGTYGGQQGWIITFYCI